MYHKVDLISWDSTIILLLDHREPIFKTQIRQQSSNELVRNLTDSYSQTRLLSVSGHNRDSKGNHAKNYAVSDLQFDSECSGMTLYVYRKA